MESLEEVGRCDSLWRNDDCDLWNDDSDLHYNRGTGSGGRRKGRDAQGRVQITTDDDDDEEGDAIFNETKVKNVGLKHRG